MRIVSTAPFLTEVIDWLHLATELVGVSLQCDSPEEIRQLPRVTEAHELAPADEGFFSRTNALLEGDRLDGARLLELDPDVVVLSIPAVEELFFVPEAVREEFVRACGQEVRVLNYNPKTLEEVFLFFQRIGSDLHAPDRGKLLEQRVRAQVMNWSDNFYERLRNKKVTFLSGVEPLRLAGYWIPDMIRLASAQSQVPPDGKGGRETSWEEVVRYRPDVIMVAPEGSLMKEAKQCFPKLEKLPGWDDVPAVKRGEVYFTEGTHLFYRPGPRLIDSMGVLISAIAGFESGYITERESFFQLRWLEIHRHRL